MFLQSTPIQRKLMAMLLITSSVVLLVTCAAFFAYEYQAFKQTTIQHLYTVGDVIAANSTSSLAFQDRQDAAEMLSALKAERHIVAGCLYDQMGNIFETYPAQAPTNQFPARPLADGYYFEHGYLATFHPVIQKGGRLGTLYLKSDMGAIYERFRLYSIVMLVVMMGSFLVAYLLSLNLQKQISRPVLSLAETARAVSQRRDYSVRAPAQGRDEFGLLTDAFNDMLQQIQDRDHALQDAQKKLQEHAESLERRVAERTSRLSETIAELESFSYSISHDMRAPLRAMQGYSEHVIQTYGDAIGPEGKQFLERIKRAGQRLDRLVQDILTYSRLSRAQLDLHPVDLEKLIEDIVHQYPGFQLPEVEITVAKPLGSVIGHEASLTQVISNLIGNAVKFIRAGEKPRIKIYSESRNGDLRLWVEDNGIGIAENDLDRIFGIFERVHPEKTYEGTGIGLSIVRKAVERMEGQVGVESELGKGSKFWIQVKRA